jgi:type II secretory pathway predicted ATPase ExeA
LTAGEVSLYIDHRLKAVGARSPLFSNEACEAIAQVSAGIPRTINIICDTALVYGYAMQTNLVTKQIVDRVIEDKRSFGIFGK